MTPLEANKILSKLALEFTDKRLYRLGGYYMSASSERKSAVLDGDFTAEHLESIATWMKDPKGVFEATQHPSASGVEPNGDQRLGDCSSEEGTPVRLLPTGD